VRDRAAGVPDISSSCEGSALDPLPTEAAKKTHSERGLLAIIGLPFQPSLDASRHYRT
jgi:hypothetical protein